MCSPTHPFNEKKLHYPIVCSKMMEVHWGQKGTRRRSGAESSHTNALSKRISLLDLKQQSFGGLIPLFVCHAHEVFLQHNSAELIASLIGGIYMYAKLKIS